MKSNARLRYVFILLVSLTLGLACGYQILGVSRDYNNYFTFFNFVRNIKNYWAIDYRFEPGFTAAVFILVKSGLSNVAIYISITACIISIKYLSIEYKKKFGVAVLIFTSYFIARYIILFEMTVLRAACAFALAFSVFMRKKTASIKIREILVLALAALFHYSAIVFFVVYLIRPSNKRIIIIAILLVFLGVYFLKTIAILYLPEYLDVFSTYQDFGEATFLPIPLIFDIIFIIYALCKFENSNLSMRYAILGMGIGIAFHFSLLDYSMIGARFNELLSMFVLIYVVQACDSRDKAIRHASLLYVVITGAMYAYLYGYYSPLLS